MDVLSLDYIDNSKTITNDIVETYNILGIEAARQTIYNELKDVIEFDGGYVNSHHMELLCDRMCYSTNMISIFRHGINNDNIGPIAKASFEETPEMFLKAARHGELDNMCGVSGNIMCGQEGYFGTGSFQTLLDSVQFKKFSQEYTVKTEYDTDLQNFQNSQCNTLIIENDISKIKDKNWEINDDDYMPDGL